MAVDPRILDLLERWEAIRREGRTISPAELCRDAPELEAEVARRIRRLEQFDDLLIPLEPEKTEGGPANADDADFVIAPGVEATGRYQPVRLHARGGLGEVYLAEDSELERTVALKRIQPRRTSDPESQRRFLLEAKITGRLEHPGIVPVYGLTQGADGQPCYAMRFIEGETLQEAIKRFHEADAQPGRDSGAQRLEFRQLLTRFVTVCNTIAYAHSRGVVHRDLKPANIMLGKYGETLVVDWGLAKAGVRGQGLGASNPRTSDQVLGSDELASISASPDTAPTVPPSGTQTGLAMGTPSYMSPEQAAGEWDRVGPPSDIYSLGATLYAILTGKPPFGSVDDLDKVLKGEVVPPRQVRNEVPAALDAICLKAMAARPEVRYESATALAADLEQWLADEPVGVWSEPWTQRLGRWGRRHRTLVTGAAALLVTAVVALAIGLWSVEHERRRTAKERDQKDQALAAETRAKSLTIKTLHKLTDNLVEERMSRRAALTDEDRRFLREIQHQYEEFAALPGDEVSQRMIRAEGSFRAAYIQDTLGEWDMAEASYQQARALYQQLAVDRADQPEFRHCIAKCQNNMGLLLRRTGRMDEARSCYAAALALGQQLAKDYPTRTEFLRGLGTTLLNWGNVFERDGRLHEAEANYTESIAIRRRLASEFPDEPRLREELAMLHHNLGNVRKETKRSEEAEAGYSDAIAIFKKLADDFPNRPEFRQQLANSVKSLGDVSEVMGNAERAEAARTEALTMQKRLAAEYPTRGEFRGDLARHLISISSRLLHRKKNASEAKRTYAEALAILRQLTSDFPSLPDYQLDLGGTLVNLAILEIEQGNPHQAQNWIVEAEPPLNRALRANPNDVKSRQYFENYLGVLAPCCAGCGEQIAALAAATRRRDIGWHPSMDAYEAARAMARCHGYTRKLKLTSAEPGETLNNFYADHAMSMLCDAVNKGFIDWERLQRAVEFDPLRQREDFKQLVESLKRD